MASSLIPANPNGAYVYAIIVDGMVRYIGKGSGKHLKRAGEHARTARRVIAARRRGVRPWARHFINRLADAIEVGSEISIIVIRDGLRHEQAFELEKVEIEARTGLWNSVGGGLGGNTVSEETRRRQSDAAKRRAATPAGRARLIAASKAAAASQTEEQKEQSRCHLAKIRADVEVQNRRAATIRKLLADPECGVGIRRGLEAGRAANSYTPERMAKIWATPEAREKASVSHKAAWARRKAAQT